MRSSRSTTQHQEAVSRRLALLGAQLAAARSAERPGPGEPREDTATPDGHTRIRGGLDRPDAVVPPARPPLPADPPSGPRPGTVVPVPGRHAARRRPVVVTSLWEGNGRLSRADRGQRPRLGLGGGQLAVVALLVVASLALTAWWWSRGEPHQEAPVTPRPAGALVTPMAMSSVAGGAAPADGADASASASTGQLVVDVEGRVRRPGIVVLPAGSRVVDAIRAAGGARAGVDLSTLNLARPVLDGEQIVVGVRARPGPPAPAVTPGSASGPVALVNLNTADQTQLEALPEVGPVTAQAIIAWRTDHGGFTAVDQLLDVTGIGAATLATIAPLVTI